MIDRMLTVVSTAQSGEYIELRYHSRKQMEISSQNKEVCAANSYETWGVGVRVLLNGGWGFCSTSHCDLLSMRFALKKAILMAANCNMERRLAPAGIASGTYLTPVNGNIEDQV